jgi:hypothetical protein
MSMDKINGWTISSLGHFTFWAFRIGPNILQDKMQLENISIHATMLFWVAATQPLDSLWLQYITSNLMKLQSLYTP